MTDEEKTKRQLIEELRELRGRLAEVEERERLLHAVVEHIPGGIAVAGSSDMSIHSANWFGRDLEGGAAYAWEWLPQAEHGSRLELLYPGNRNRPEVDQHPIVRALHGETIWDEEWILCRPDGRELAISCNAGPVRNGEGRITGSVAAWRDITARKRAEEALLDLRERFRIALSGSGVGTWSWDVGAEVATCDGYPHPVFGKSGTLMATREDFFGAIHPEDRDRLRAAITGIFEPGKEEELHSEYRVVWPDGSVHWILDRVRVYRDEAGQPRRMAGVCLDITDRKSMESTLRFKEELLRLTLDQAPIGAAIAGLDHRFKSVNAELCRITGYSEEELLSLSLTDITHPEDIALNLSLAERLLEGEISQFKMEKRYVRKDGTTSWGNVLVRMVRDAEGRPLHILSMVEDITERKRVEEALQASERRLRRLVEANIIGIIFANTRGYITEANDAFLKMIGYSREELLEGRLRWTDITPPEYFEADERAVCDLREKGFCMPFEKEYIRKDGRRVPVLLGIASLEGSWDEVVCFALDLSERRHMEEALKDSESKYRLLFETMVQGVAFHDSTGAVIATNPAAEGILGLSQEEIQKRDSAGINWAPIHEDGSPFRDEDRPTMVALRTGKTVRDEIMGIFNPKENAYRWVKVSSIPHFHNGETKPCMVYSIFGDITELKRAKEALEDANAQLDQKVKERTAELVKSNAALRAEIVERKKVEDALRLDDARLEALLAFSQMWDSSRRSIADFVLSHIIKLTGSKIGLLGWIDENEQDFTFLANSMGGEGHCDIRKQRNHPSFETSGLWEEIMRQREPVILNDFQSSEKESFPLGHIPLLRLMCVPVFSDGRMVALAAVANKEEDYDPSDVRQLSLLMDGLWKMIQRKRTEAALRESERLASMGRALSGVAHDLKTPLVAIGGFTRLVQRHLEKDDPDWEKLQIVLKETERLERMVKDMLDFSRPLELDRSHEDIHRIIEESLVIVSPMAMEKGVKLERGLNRNALPVMCDPMRMKQLILNLLTNAIQATPPGQIVTVSAREHRGIAIIDISDSGCGIPVERREEIFLPFVSTKKEGTGLGLAIVKKIIDAHGGHIEALDGPRGGATFRVSLPTIRER